MAFDNKVLGEASIVFLALFVVYELHCLFIMSRVGMKNLNTLLAFYGIVRIGGQVSGLGFALQGFAHWQWLIAYLVLSAEGYFFLVLSILYCLVKEQVAFYGKSPLKKPLIGQMGFEKIFHIILIPANAILIAGGVMLTSVNHQDLTNANPTVKTSKGLRTAGQAIFLLQSITVIGITFWSYSKGLKSKAMYLLMLTAPFILVRGAYGLMSIYISDMNYFVYSNYSSMASNRKVIGFEYGLAISMEFITANLLVFIYWVTRNNPPPPHLEEGEQKLMETESASTKEFYEHLLFYKLGKAVARRFNR